MAKFPENGTPAEQAAYMREWGCGGCQRGAKTIDALAADNAVLRAELAFARSTGDESALEYHALKARLDEVERERDDAQRSLSEHSREVLAKATQLAEAKSDLQAERVQRAFERQTLEARLAESERANELNAEECVQQAKRAARAENILAEAEHVCKEQAEDEGLWFVAETITESYLQSALRRLHAAVEGDQ